MQSMNYLPPDAHPAPAAELPYSTSLFAQPLQQQPTLFSFNQPQIQTQQPPKPPRTPTPRWKSDPFAMDSDDEDEAMDIVGITQANAAGDSDDDVLPAAANDQEEDIASSVKPRRRYKDPKKGGANDALDAIVQKVGAVDIEKEGAWSYDPSFNEDLIDNLLVGHARSLRQAIQSDVPEYQLNAMRSFNEFISADYKGNAKKLLSTDFLPSFEKFLKPETREDILNETISVLINIAAGPPSHTAAVVDAGFVPRLFRILEHPASTLRTRTKAIWVLGNVAADNEQFRNLLLEARLEDHLLRIFKENWMEYDKGPLRTSMWVLRNVLGWRNPDWKMLQKTIATLPELLSRQSTEVAVDLAYSFDHLMANGIGKEDSVDRMITLPLCRQIMEMLTPLTPSAITKPMLEAVINISNGKPAIVETLLSAGLLDVLRQYLDPVPYSNNRVNALAVLANLVRFRKPLYAICKEDLFLRIVNLLRVGDPSTRKEACWVVANAAAMKDVEVAGLLFGLNATECLLEYFEKASLPAAYKALCGIVDLLETGDKFAGSFAQGQAPNFGAAVCLHANPVAARIAGTQGALLTLWNKYEQLSGGQLGAALEAEDNGDLEESDSDKESSDDEDGEIGNGPNGMNGMKGFKIKRPKVSVPVWEQICACIKGITARWFMNEFQESVGGLGVGGGDGMVGRERREFEALTKGMTALMG